MLFILAGLVVIISSFLDWATVQYQGTEIGKIVGRSVNYGTGAVLIILGAFVFARGIFRGAKVLMLVVGVLNALWTVLLYAALQQSSNDLIGTVIPGATATYSIQVGFILVIIGALLALAGAGAGATAGGGVSGPAASTAMPPPPSFAGPQT
jgi:hypothetical protein